MQKGRGANETPLPRKTPHGAQVALQHCLILHMSKRKIILQGGGWDVNKRVALFYRDAGIVLPTGWP